MARLALDISSLRASRPFRWHFVGNTTSGIGSQATSVALFYQAYDMTGSALASGLVGLCQLVPIVVFSLLGGAIADSMNRRTLMVCAQIYMLCISVLLIMCATLGWPIAAVYTLAALSAAGAAIDGPVRTAIIPQIVDKQHLTSAITIREALTQITRLAGPVVGGFAIGIGGVALAYTVDVVSFVIALACFARLPSLMPSTRTRFSLASITDGIGFLRDKRALASTFYADLIAMIFGMPRAVFPALAATVFFVDGTKVGLMFSAIAAGAMIGVLTSGWTHRVDRQGCAVLVSVAAWGGFIMLFGMTSSYWIALALLACAGWADAISAIFRQSMLYAIVPDEYRGRLSSVHIMVVTGGPQLGDVEAGVLADEIGVQDSVVTGGAACLALVLILAVAVPEFRRWSKKPAG